MKTSKKIHATTERYDLSLTDFVEANTTCGIWDPGPDPTWYSEPFPDDEEDDDDHQ